MFKRKYKDTLLVTFDVVNLYTTIPHTFGLETLDYWLENHPKSLHARFNKEFVLECAKFILQNNNMKFNNEYYHQIKGTAMGTISLQLMQLYRWDILKSNFIVSALLNMKNF